MDAAQARIILDIFAEIGSDPPSAEQRERFRRLEQQHRLRSAILASDGRLTPEGRRFRDGLRNWLQAQAKLDSFVAEEVQYSEGFVLVVGSAHLDIYADFPEHQSSYKDKLGYLTFSVGGSALNIASNLAAHGVPVSLLTHLPQRSLVTEPILRYCSRAGIDKSHIRLCPIREEVGFVAHRCNGDLHSAVTATIVDRVAFDDNSLSGALAGCKFVVIECNLNPEQIHHITQRAHEAGKPVFGAGVSDAKAGRAQSVYVPEGEVYGMELFMLNELEAQWLLEHSGSSHEGVCRRAKSRVTVITRGVNGLCVYEDDRIIKHIQAPAIRRIRSVSGAGDALLSAACKCYYDKGEFEWEWVMTIARGILDGVLATDVAVADEAATIEIVELLLESVGGKQSNRFAQDLRTLEETGQLTHAPDFSSMTKFGTYYPLTGMQGACMRCLWNNFERGAPDVRAERILEEIGSSGAESQGRSASKVLFENIWKSHRDRWNALVGIGRVKGSYRLNVENNRPRRRRAKA